MKNTKIMLSGIVIFLLAIWCAAMSGTGGSPLGGISICLLPVGLIVILMGVFKK